MNKSEILNMPYNKNSLKEIEKCLKENKTFVCSNAMGSGKSLLIEKLANKRRFKKVLIVVKDTRTTVAKMAHANNWDCITYYKLVSKDTSDYDCVICDEAHHILSDGCKSKARQLQKQKKLYLFTSTTQRTDRQDLVDLVDCEINYLTFGDAVIAGIYAKPTYIQSYLREADTPSYKVKVKLDGRSAYETLEKYIKNQNKIVVFETTNKQMENDYEILGKPLQDLGFKTRMFTSKHYDENTLEWFNTNNKVALFTCNLLNESHHIEGLDCEIILRHTSSLIVVNQQIGRIATFDTNRKIVILDLACNHKLIATFAEGSKLDELGDYFKITDKDGNLKKSNIRDVLNVEFDTEQLDIWSSRLKVTYNGIKYLATDFCKMYNIRYTVLRVFLQHHKVYTDNDINEIIKHKTPMKLIYVDGNPTTINAACSKYSISRRILCKIIKDIGIYLNSENLTDKKYYTYSNNFLQVKDIVGNKLDAFRSYCYRKGVDASREIALKYMNEVGNKTPRNKKVEINYKGRAYSIVEISKIAKVSPSVIRWRIKTGMPLEKVFSHNIRELKIFDKVYNGIEDLRKKFRIEIPSGSEAEIEKYLRKSFYGLGTGKVIIEWKEFDDMYSAMKYYKVNPLKYSEWCNKTNRSHRMKPNVFYKYLKEKHKLKNKGRKE